MKSNTTVIIPCYNDGKYIIEALNSVLSQTLKAEKIIIIDDGSDVETKKILNNINIENVEVIFQNNKGVCVARNIGIDLAKTDYILNLDADDYFEATFLEKAVSILNNNLDIGVVGCYYKILKNNRLDPNVVKPVGGSVKNLLVNNNAINCSLYRKVCWNKVLGYDENMKEGYEDWDFWISILKHGWDMHILKEPLFVYRIKQNSRDIVAFKEHHMKLKLYLFEKHKQVYLDNFESYFNQVTYINYKLKLNNLKSTNTKASKIGNAILAPIRFLKIKIFK
ncbi:glycosyltransferase family 2 protein [Algibacter pectinivorans]|uniref:Glycosyltransferase 2-like domain-containing protein n=1 Tax=Algibacter pectinivorans TaxID=870482 RepID=A0A1I1NYE4_9FLAO|nr:glycosyltransferase family A protein [Algibacter pectinivorans]SFD02567.1 hypothetical protein SAMN04487987_10321 [Algibacter pectinivorans]